MRYRRNADEESRRRQRAMSTDHGLVNHVVADKLRAGRASEITLGELAGVTDRSLVQAIPNPVWQAMLNKIPGAGRIEEIQVQLGPARASVLLTENGEYPSVAIMAPGYAAHASYPVVVVESADDQGGGLRVLIYSDPYDQEGAPTHYVNLTPYNPALGAP